VTPDQTLGLGKAGPGIPWATCRSRGDVRPAQLPAQAAPANGTLKVQRFEGPTGIPLAEGTAYTVQPATSPAAAEWSTANNGTEYALPALDFSAK